MPEAHRQHAAGVNGVLAWAATVGPMTLALVERLLAANPVREQGYRSARGLQRVGQKYGPLRTELACERALSFGARSDKPVANILALGRETAPRPVQPFSSSFAGTAVRFSLERACGEYQG
jgi:hypothetical protein